MQRKNVKKYFLGLSLLFLLIVFPPLKTKAQTTTCEEDLEVKVIFRNSQGDFIPNVSFEAYDRVEDADGNPKPGQKKASGKTSAYLGYGVVEKNFPTHYALKAWTINTASFWFYDDIVISDCSNITATHYFSDINVVLRDSQGVLRKNTKFSIYSQREDVDGKPIKEKQDLIGTFDTSEEGEVKVYIPSSERAVDGNGPNYYVFEAVGKMGSVFTKYDINITDRSTTKVEYHFSDMKLALKDKNDNSFPGGTKIEIYKQIKDVDGDNAIGTLVKEIYTDDNGEAILEYPAGTYAARVKGADNEFQYFYDLIITDQKRETYKLTTSESWDPGQAACLADMTFSLFTKTIDGIFIPGLKFELYERTADADNNPIPGVKIGAGTCDSYGKCVLKIKPDPRKQYLLKIYDKNANTGAFWYYDDLQFVCSENKELTKNLPSTNIVLRDGNGNLKKNQKFSLYLSKIDIDGNPVVDKNNLVGNFTTNTQGNFVIYLGPKNEYNPNEPGAYIFTSRGENADYIEYNLNIADDTDTKFEYIYSDLVVTLKNAAGQVYKNKSLDFYELTRSTANSLGKKLKSFKTDIEGKVRVEYPAGMYAIGVKDDLSQDNMFWDINIANRKRNAQIISANTTRIYVKGVPNAGVNIYSMIENENGEFLADKKKKTLKIGNLGYIELSLAPGPYLFSNVFNKLEYGKALYVENGKLQTITIEQKSGNELAAGKKYKLTKPTGIGSIRDRLKGYILLQVESLGEAWYVNPADSKRYYLKDGPAAYEIMRKLSIGAKTIDLEKIIIGTDDRLEEFDYDGDSLPDDTENAIGSDMYLDDSDNDTYKDGVEAFNGYNPVGSGKWPIDKKFANAQKGRILLQVEDHGEAWYINPKDGRRFYMKDGDAAYKIMRFLSLGIKNADLEKIEIGILSN